MHPETEKALLNEATLSLIVGRVQRVNSLTRNLYSSVPHDPPHLLDGITVERLGKFPPVYPLSEHK